MPWLKPLLTVCLLTGLVIPGRLLAEPGDDPPKPPPNGATTARNAPDNPAGSFSSSYPSSRS